MVKVAIGDGSDAYRAALCAVLGQEPDLRCVGEAPTVDALVTLIQTTSAEVAIVDAKLPLGGIPELADRLRTPNARCRVVAVAAMPSIGARHAAERAGAAGLIAKSDGPEILAAVRDPER